MAKKLIKSELIVKNTKRQNSIQTQKNKKKQNQKLKIIAEKECRQKFEKEARKISEPYIK